MRHEADGLDGMVEKRNPKSIAMLKAALNGLAEHKRTEEKGSAGIPPFNANSYRITSHALEMGPRLKYALQIAPTDPAAGISDPDMYFLSKGLDTLTYAIDGISTLSVADTQSLLVIADTPSQLLLGLRRIGDRVPKFEHYMSPEEFGKASALAKDLRGMRR